MLTRSMTKVLPTLAALVAVLIVGAVPSRAQTKRYPVTGLVLRVDVAARIVLVSHDAIEGLMPAMTMPFEVRAAKDLQGIEPGMTVAFSLVLGATTAVAEQVRVLQYESVEQDPLTARRLRMLQRLIGGGPEPVAVGAAVPDFTLTSQARTTQTLSQLRGKVVVVNFIYTGCPLPQFCVRITNHFGVLQKRFRGRSARDLALLTVTFDPGRDTPERLAEHARQWNADPALWQFLTGPAPEIQRVAGSFGVDVFPDEGLLTHSLRTAVIDRRGVLVANIEGNRYTAAQLGDLVEATLARK
jgi:protein SCO1